MHVFLGPGCVCTRAWLDSSVFSQESCIKRCSPHERKSDKILTCVDKDTTGSAILFVGDGVCKQYTHFERMHTRKNFSCAWLNV